jgi:hypothetical protein
MQILAAARTSRPPEQSRLCPVNTHLGTIVRGLPRFPASAVVCVSVPSMITCPAMPWVQVTDQKAIQPARSRHARDVDLTWYLGGYRIKIADPANCVCTHTFFGLVPAKDDPT